MSNLTPEELARKAGEQGTFSFVDRLRGRNYAKDSFDIYLDEELGLTLLRLEAAFNSEDVSVDLKAEIEQNIKQVREALNESKYTVHVEGISNERYDELIDLAAEDFPYEYDEYTDTWSGKRKKEIINSDERNELFTRLLWAECIKKIVDNTGAVDDNVTDETVDWLRKTAPLAAIKRIADGIDKVRMATEWIDYLEDEDFFHRP